MPSATAGADALLFDLGGVVIQIDFDRAIRAWAEAGGVPASQVHARFSLDAGYEAHERGEMEPAAYCAHLRQTLGLELADEHLLSGWNRIFVGEVPQVGPLLAKLAESLPLYAFSNTNAAHRTFCRPAATCRSGTRRSPDSGLRGLGYRPIGQFERRRRHSLHL